MPKTFSSLIISATGWQYYLLNIWSFSAIKICPNSSKNGQSRFKIYPKTNLTLWKWHSRFIFYQIFKKSPKFSDEILPNLDTLLNHPQKPRFFSTKKADVWATLTTDRSVIFPHLLSSQNFRLFTSTTFTLGVDVVHISRPLNSFRGLRWTLWLNDKLIPIETYLAMNIIIETDDV